VAMVFRFQTLVSVEVNLEAHLATLRRERIPCCPGYRSV
jgi:hypothetical protein